MSAVKKLCPDVLDNFDLHSVCLFLETTLSLYRSQYRQTTGVVQQWTQTVVEVRMWKMRCRQFAENLELCPLLHLCTFEKAASLPFGVTLVPNILGVPEVSNHCVQLGFNYQYFTKLLTNNRMTVVMTGCLYNVFFVRLVVLLQVICFVKWLIENGCALLHHLSTEKALSNCFRCKSIKACSFVSAHTRI